jgi:hypothetical protein
MEGGWGAVLQVTEIRNRVFGEDHPDTVRSMSDLVRAYSIQMRWKEAEELRIQMTDRIRMRLGEDHPSTVVAIADLASIREASRYMM